MNNLNMATVFSAALGQAYTLAGRSADAVALLEDTVIRSETYNRANRALWLNFLSEAYLRAGCPSDAAGAAQARPRGGACSGRSGVKRPGTSVPWPKRCVRMLPM